MNRKRIAAAILVSLAALPAMANAPSTVMSCNHFELYEAGVFKPADFSVTVVASNASPQSYKAIVVSGGRSHEERDVEIRNTSAADARELKEMSETLLPGLKWEQVFSVRAANINAKASREDGSGLLLIELFDKKQASLGKIVEIGWGFGRCQ